MFVVFGGSVTLDFGVDSAGALTNLCGPGALVGLPATLSRTSYATTATVVDDADLGFLSSKRLFELLRDQPELCKDLLVVLSAKVAHAHEVQKAVLFQSTYPAYLPS